MYNYKIGDKVKFIYDICLPKEEIKKDFIAKIVYIKPSAMSPGKNYYSLEFKEHIYGHCGGFGECEAGKDGHCYNFSENDLNKYFILLNKNCQLELNLYE
jgi:hypothetical protein